MGVSSDVHGGPAAPPVQVSGDDVHAHARHTGHRWLDLVIAMSAITISIISLFVAIEHGRTEARLVAASSWPFLVYTSENDGIDMSRRAIVMRLDNNGVGPARVQSVSVLLDGKAVRSREALMAACCGVAKGQPIEAQVALGLYSQNPMVGVLPARSSVTFLGWRQMPQNREVFDRLDRARHRLTFRACYCSVLDECWTTDLKSTSTPTPVSQCPIGNGYGE